MALFTVTNSTLNDLGIGSHSIPAGGSIEVDVIDHYIAEAEAAGYVTISSSTLPAMATGLDYSALSSYVSADYTLINYDNSPTVAQIRQNMATLAAYVSQLQIAFAAFQDEVTSK